MKDSFAQYGTQHRLVDLAVMDFAVAGWRDSAREWLDLIVCDRMCARVSLYQSLS